MAVSTDPAGPRVLLAACRHISAASTGFEFPVSYLLQRGVFLALLQTSRRLLATHCSLRVAESTVGYLRCAKACMGGMHR